MPDNIPGDKAEQDSKKVEAPDVLPGTIAPQEVFESEPVDLTDTEISTIKSLCSKVQQKDLAAWREEIIRAWEQRLFDRGYQNLLWSRSQGWTLPAPGTGYHPTDAGSRSMFNANIFSSYEEMIISALSREFPTTRFEPNDEDSDVDITAAEAAEKLKSSIERNIGSKILLRDIDRLLCTDGRVMLETKYVKDSQRFGFEPENDGVVPEDETTTPELASGNSETISGSIEPGAEGTPAETSERENQRVPRGRETVRAWGALETKVPMKANCLAECDYLQLNTEIPISVAKAMYPDKQTSITAATAGPGGDNIARLARINVNLGVENNFITTDTAAYDVTWQQSWFRPSIFFCEEVDENMRNGLLEKFPNGMRAVYMGETFCEARSISMDDHWTLIHARSGDGIHRASLLQWLLPIQKVLNNLLDLANDYLTRGVPMTWFPEGPFSREQIQKQTRVPGGFSFYVPDPAMPDTRNAIFVEEQLPFPEQLLLMIQWLGGDLAQLLTGCFPALFGGDTGTNDTMGGIAIQRDQALGRLGVVWGRIKEGLSSVMRQSVECLAKSGQNVIRTVGKDSVLVETQDLKGNIHCFPETDENFPESWVQKQARMAVLIADAATNPMLTAIVDDPNNLELLKNGMGLTEITIPQLASRDKQLGENEILLKSAPIPNPELMQAQQQLLMLQQQALTGDPTVMMAAEQASQQIAQIPPLISSVDIDPEIDDHATEAMTALSVLRSPKGRGLKSGTDAERQAYENLRLHYLEHKKLVPPPNQNMQKPVSQSINIKDLPPQEAAQLAGKAGIQANPQDFEIQDVQQAAEKHPATPIPVVK